MTSPKRPQIQPYGDVPRTAPPRSAVVIEGACQVGERPVEETLIADLEAGGCRLLANTVGVTKAEPVLLWIGETGPIAARLESLKQGSLVLAFACPLASDVLQPFLEASAVPLPSNVVPLARRFAG